MASLSASDANRLAKILALLGLDKTGEVAAAAHMASQFLRARDLQWADIVRPAPAANPWDASWLTPPQPTWRNTVAAGSQHPDRLSAWEVQFLSSLARFPQLSPKQAARLTEIATRLRTAGVQM